MTKEANERLRRVESILVTQLTTPNNQAPYDKLVEKYGIKIDYRSFTEVRPVAAKDFRKQRINLEEFTAVIFTSKSSIDHFFKVCEELRFKVSEELKYFCLSEATALYLQKHITYRKRKVFFGKNTLPDLKPTLVKHKKKERFLLPCSNISQSAYTDILNECEINYQAAEMYQAVSSDISDLENVFYDMIVFFSPLSIDALYDNFPEFKQNNTRLAAYGATTIKAMEEKGLIVDIQPTTEQPSMTSVIETYIRAANNL